MTDFMDMFVEMLPMASNLQNKNNEVRKVLDYTIGEYMENISDIGDELFLTSATGGWLDAWGRDYGVIRRVDEDDDSFRERIIFEKLEYLTAHNLKSIYGVQLFSAFDGFDATENDLTSDNPYLTDWYMGVADSTVQGILDKKFILGGNIVWYNGTILDYIKNGTVNLLKKYRHVYNLNRLYPSPFENDFKSVKLTLPYIIGIDSGFRNQTSLIDIILDCPIVTSGSGLFSGCTGLETADLNLPLMDYAVMMFEGCTSLEEVNLDSPELNDGTAMFRGCTDLETVDLDFPKLKKNKDMFWGSTSLKSVTLNFPSITSYTHMFNGCSALETIDVVIPTSIVNDFKSYVLGLNLSNLTSFKINGEEVDLS